MGNRLLLADLPGPEVLPDPVEVPGIRFGPALAAGTEALGRAYWETHGGEEGHATLAEAVTDLGRAFNGAYGRFLAEASLAAWDEADGTVVGGVLVVDAAPWEDIPCGPFVIDLFVVESHRRRGIGSALMRTAMATVGSGQIGLRVEDDATAARALYETLGFRTR